MKDDFSDFFVVKVFLRKKNKEVGFQTRATFLVEEEAFEYADLWAGIAKVKIFKNGEEVFYKI